MTQEEDQAPQGPVYANGPSSTNDPDNAQSGPIALIIAAAVVLCLMAAGSTITAILGHLIIQEYESSSSSSLGLDSGDGYYDGYGDQGYGDQGYGFSSGSGSSDEYWYPIR